MDVTQPTTTQTFDAGQYSQVVSDQAAESDKLRTMTGAQQDAYYKNPNASPAPPTETPAPVVISSAKPAAEDLNKKMTDINSYPQYQGQIPTKTIYWGDGKAQMQVLEPDFTNYWSKQGWRDSEQVQGGTGAPGSQTPSQGTTGASGNVVATGATPMETPGDEMRRRQDEISLAADQALVQHQKDVANLQLTPEQQQQIDALTQQFQSLINEQKIANQNYTSGVTRAGISAGRNIYAPEVEYGNINAAIQSGIQAVGKINAEMSAAVAKAKQAFLDNNYTKLNDAYKLLEDARTRKQTEIENIYKIGQDAIANARADHSQKLEDQKFEFAKEQELNKPLQEASKAARDYAYEMALKYPDIDITPQDTLATINEKVQQSQVFKDELQTTQLQQEQIRASTAAAYASATASRSSAAAKAGETAPSAAKTERVAKVKSLVEEIKNDTALPNAVGPISKRLPTIKGKTADFEFKVQQLKSLLTIENLGIMKGVLSDSDIKILSSAASALDLGMSEEGFKKELENIAEKVAAAETAVSVANKGFTADLPNGQTMYFETQEQADAFKKEAGL
jgi:hypothetical protein